MTMYAQKYPSYGSNAVHSQPAWAAPGGVNSNNLYEADEMYVKQFEKNVLNSKTRAANPRISVKIPEIRCLLERSSQLIYLLKECSSCTISSQISSLKLELDTIQHIVQSSLDDTEKKVNKRAMKRLRSRNCRERKKLEYDSLIKEGCEKADQWLAEEEAKKLKLKMEKEVKTSAAKALLEVETKQTDIDRHIRIVELLKQLKSLRAESQHRSTELTAVEADLKFYDKVKFLHEFLLLRKKEYEKEMKALHVMMEEEVQDRIAAVTTSHRPEQPLSLTSQDGHPTLQEAAAVYAVLHIRQQWDAFLSPVGTPLSPDPVVPSLPGSADWETYLVTR